MEQRKKEPLMIGKALAEATCRHFGIAPEHVGDIVIRIDPSSATTITVTLFARESLEKALIDEFKTAESVQYKLTRVDADA